MDLNRNQYFMVGVVVLLLGIQFRMVDSYLLNERASQYVVKLWKKKGAQQVNTPRSVLGPPAPAVVPQKKIKFPNWTGWATVSIGAVLILHSLAMKKPE